MHKCTIGCVQVDQPVSLDLLVTVKSTPRGRDHCLCQLCSPSPVVATMRDLGKKGALEAAAGETLGRSLIVAQMDVCSDESVAQCLSSIPGGDVDVLGEPGSPLPPVPDP